MTKKLAKNVMQNLEEATIAPEKISDYLLKPNTSKARVFLAAFALTPNDDDFLTEGILSALPTGEVIEKKKTEYGLKFVVMVDFKGKNGHTEKVKTTWQ